MTVNRSADVMNLHVGCRLGNSVTTRRRTRSCSSSPTRRVQDTIVEERWESAQPAERFADLYGNVCRRFELTPENAAFSYDATVRISPEPGGDAGRATTSSTASRSSRPSSCTGSCRAACASPTRSRTRPGSSSARLRAGRRARRRPCATGSTSNVAYGVASLPTTTVREIFARRGGMCRDFAHLGVTFCRALGIPARYVFGYMPDIGIPGPFPPMDFHAWFEV